jgi:protein-S-isoprenylcysteine O-methyltransferase Ste14
MHALRIAIAITWAAFWIYWLGSAVGAKQSTGRLRRLPLNGVTALTVFVLVRVFRGGSLAVHSPVLAAIGAAVFACGLGLIVTALATDLLGLIVAVVLTAYFYYSASVEERDLIAMFPKSYPAYRTATKMLIPFVL